MREIEISLFVVKRPVKMWTNVPKKLVIHTATML